MVLERPSAAKSSAQWCCEHQIATSMLADVFEADSFCARSTSRPRKNSDHRPVLVWERHKREVERSARVAEGRHTAPGWTMAIRPMRCGRRFISTVLEHGAKSKDVQRTVGHADPSTTKLYDRRRFMAAK
jgi:site-specific recombinase XerD